MALNIKTHSIFDTFEETIVLEDEMSDRNLKVSVNKFIGSNNWHPFDELKLVTKEVFRDLRNEHSSTARN